LEDDVGVDIEEEVTELRLCFGDLSCNDSEMYENELDSTKCKSRRKRKEKNLSKFE
jgi:hypothetical protein